MGFVSCPRNKKTLKLGQKNKCHTNHCCFGFFDSIITADKWCGWGVQLRVDTGRWLLNKDRCGIFLLMRRRSMGILHGEKSPSAWHIFWSCCSLPSSLCFFAVPGLHWLFVVVLAKIFQSARIKSSFWLSPQVAMRYFLIFLNDENHGPLNVKETC